MYHSLGLIAIGLVAQARPSALLTGAGWAMLAGIVLFSGSLYALALTGVRALGAITPLGGLGFLAGWALLAVGRRGAREPEPHFTFGGIGYIRSTSA